MPSSHDFSIRRKPAPQTDPRYPSFDPSDPFAPLWVLRDRALSTTTEPTFTTVFSKAPLSNTESVRYHRQRAQSSPIMSLSSAITIADRSRLSTCHVIVSSGGLQPSSIPVPSIVSNLNHEKSALSLPKPIQARTPTPRGKAKMIKTRSQHLADDLSVAPPQGNLVENAFDKHLISSPANFKHLVSGCELQISHSLLNPGKDVEFSRVPSAPTTISRRRPKHTAEVFNQHQTDIISSPTASLPFTGPLPVIRPTRHSISTSDSMRLTWSKNQTATSSSSSTSHTLVDSPSSTSSIPSKKEHTRRRSRTLSKLGAAMPVHSAAPEWSLPDTQSLAKISALPVVAESGIRVPFGSLLTAQRTIVIFLRHFWCPQCQDYMASLTSLAQPELMVTELAQPTVGKKAKRHEQVQLILIGNGSFGMIAKYRRMFRTPFSMYTDPTLALYSAFGMGRLDKGLSAFEGVDKDTSSVQEKKVQDGGYLRHGAVGAFAAVVGRALRVGMPIWEDAGDKGQLGGEFIFGPGMSCLYAHRMQSAKGHVPAGDILAAAGIDLPSLVRSREVPVDISRKNSLLSNPSRIFPARRKTSDDLKVPEAAAVAILIPKRQSVLLDGTVNARSSFVLTSDEEEEWMIGRVRSLERLKEKKNRRRGTSTRPNELDVSRRNQICTRVDESEETAFFIADDETLAAIANILE